MSVIDQKGTLGFSFLEPRRSMTFAAIAMLFPFERPDAINTEIAAAAAVRALKIGLHVRRDVAGADRRRRLGGGRRRSGEHHRWDCDVVVLEPTPVW